MKVTFKRALLVAVLACIGCDSFASQASEETESKQKKADLNKKDEALLDSAKRNDLEMVKKTIEAGANVNASKALEAGMVSDKEKTATIIKFSDESQKLRSSLIDKYKPNSENSRPLVRHDETGKLCSVVSTNSLIYDFESIIACMVTGFKDVFWSIGELKDLEDFKQSSTAMKKLIKEYGISAFLLSDPELNPDGILLFTQAGKKNAMLLLKAQNDYQALDELGDNHYIIGYLLGYLEKDIKAFYCDPGMKKLDAFEQDKKQALAWITKEAPTIEEWVATQIQQKIFTPLN